jgi:hypothetical protein
MPIFRAAHGIFASLLLVFTVGPAWAQNAAPSPSGPAAPSAAPAPAAPPSNPELAAAIAEADAAFKVRDEPGKMAATLAALQRAEKIAPNDYEVLWRLAQYYYWLADDPQISNEEKARLGKITWDYGDRASQANPARVEGWFFGSAGVGNYALGISIVKALFDGMESKYLDRLKKAQEADPSFYQHGAFVSWGRYYYELPWPKYDGEKSEMWYRKALRQSPKNLRAKVYLAELYAKEDHPAEARKLLDAVLAARPGEYDAPEERRAQGLARAALAKMQ